MAKSAIPDARRGNFFWVDPADLHLVDDPQHLLYDPRVKAPPDADLMASIAARGIHQPIGARKDGKRLDVVWGRRRVKAALELNKTRSKADRVLVPTRVFSGTDQEAYLSMLEENTQRQDDPPSLVAAKLSRGLKFGCSEHDLAEAAKCTPETIRNRLKLLDADAAVLKAVDNGVIGEVQARKLTDLSRNEQKKTLDEMVANGATRGAKSRKVIADKVEKNGHKETGNRKLSRADINRWLDELKDVPDSGSVVGALRMVIGDREALGGKYRPFRPKFLFVEDGKAE